MQEYSGILAGLPWTGRVVERTEDLRPFMEWVAELARRGETVCFDTETLGLGIYYQAEAMRRSFIRLAQFGTSTEAWAVPVELGAPFANAARYALRTLPALVGHNVIGYDGPVVDRHLGFTLEELCAKTTDTMITSKLIDPRSPEAGGLGAALKPQAAFYVDPASPDTQSGLTKVFNKLKLTKATGWAGIDLFQPTYVEYSLLDVILGSRLHAAHAAETKRLGIRPELVAYEHELSRICAVMARAGMLVDRPYTESLYSELDGEYEAQLSAVERYGVAKLGNASQIAAALAGMGEVWPDVTESGAPRVDASVLLHMADLTEKWERIGGRTPNPLAEAVLRAKRATKWGTAYVDTFLEQTDPDGYIHPNINTLQARTGRMSVTGPALQTLPSRDKMIRRCLLSDPGEAVISVDFAAVEMRVLAALADVKQMKTAIAAGEDLHGFTARLVYGEDYTPYHRKVCKGIGFGKVYGGGAATVARQTGAPEADVRSAMLAYDRAYPEIKRASARWQRETRGNGMVFTSATGRRLPVDRNRAYAVVNYACQSAARDCLGQAMIDMDDAGLLPYLRLPIHDEVLAFAPAAEAEEIGREIAKHMTFDLYGVPITAEAEIGGRSWGSLYGADF